MSVPGHRDSRPQRHAVQFYRSDENLCSTAACFLAEGLVVGQPCIAIATSSHRSGIVDDLSRRYIDCDRAIRTGDLLLLDAAATIDLFVVNGEPDWELFQGNVTRLLNSMLERRRHRQLRLYGEGVDVLWRRGQSDAAAKLEEFWNHLSVHYSLAVLCGYAVENFYGRSEQLEAVCAQHSHLVADDGNVTNFPTRATKSM